MRKIAFFGPCFKPSRRKKIFGRIFQQTSQVVGTLTALFQLLEFAFCGPPSCSARLPSRCPVLTVVVLPPRQALPHGTAIGLSRGPPLRLPRPVCDMTRHHAAWSPRHRCQYRRHRLLTQPVVARGFKGRHGCAHLCVLSSELFRCLNLPYGFFPFFCDPSIDILPNLTWHHVMYLFWMIFRVLPFYVGRFQQHNQSPPAPNGNSPSGFLTNSKQQTPILSQQTSAKKMTRN